MSASFRHAWSCSHATQRGLIAALAVPPPRTYTGFQLEASSAVAPATASEPAQIIRVRKTPPDGGGGCTRQAQNGDLIEMSYEGRLADGTIFDGMELAKQRGDSTIQFVLGRQPGGQFPPSWDVGMVGMCVGERRTISVPPVLGFGPTGLVKKGVQLVPPNARVIYDVEAVAINALATP